MCGNQNVTDEAIDHALNYTEEMDDVKIKLDLLVFRLLNDGFSEDEVYEMVNNLLPEGMEELTEEDEPSLLDKEFETVPNQNEGLSSNDDDSWLTQKLAKQDKEVSKNLKKQMLLIENFLDLDFQ